MQALVPIKRIRDAKQRLAPFLSAYERDTLCRAMAQDVLKTLTSAPEISDVHLVSDDSAVSALARQFNCGFLSEAELSASGLNGVVAAAAAKLSGGQSSSLLIVHADLPLITATEVSRLCEAHASLDRPALTVATDRHGHGSNALLVDNPAKFDFCFGEDSCRLHVEAAERLGYKSRVERLAGFGLDIDTAQDLELLESLTKGSSGTRTGQVLSGFERGRFVPGPPGVSSP